MMCNLSSFRRWPDGQARSELPNCGQMRELPVPKGQYGQVEDKLQIRFKADLLTHGDADFLGQVVTHALKVPGWISGLNVPSGISGAARKYVLAGRGVPRGAPRAPGERAGGFAKCRIDPAAVEAELNA